MGCVVEAIRVPEGVGVREGGEDEGGHDAEVGLAGAAEGFEEGWVCGGCEGGDDGRVGEDEAVGDHAVAGEAVAAGVE